MSVREDLKALYEQMSWEQEQLRKQIVEIETKFDNLKQAYTMVENQLKIFKQLLKDF